VKQRCRPNGILDQYIYVKWHAYRYAADLEISGADENLLIAAVVG
jgi:hypothetical protein